MGTLESGSDEAPRTLFHGYTSDEFVIFDDKGNIQTQLMADLEIEGTKNPVGSLPGVYINRSKYQVMPKRDSDTLAMTLVVPVWLTDLSYALKYQVFSVLYTIDVDQSGLKQSPNALWDLKSNAGLGDAAKPSVGVIKPEVDSDKALNFIKAVFTLWMETRNIKPGAMGQMSGDNLASGVAKIIDEADTSGDRQSQVPFFKTAEEELFTVIKDHYHEYWSNEPDFQFRGQAFSSDAAIKVTFSEQKPNVDSTKAIDDQDKQIKMRIQSRKGALKALNPDWTDAQVDDRLAEVDEEAAPQGDEAADPAQAKEAKEAKEEMAEGVPV